MESSEADGHLTLSKTYVFMVMGMGTFVSRVRLPSSQGLPDSSDRGSPSGCQRGGEDHGNLSSGTFALCPTL